MAVDREYNYMLLKLHTAIDYMGNQYKSKSDKVYLLHQVIVYWFYCIASRYINHKILFSFTVINSFSSVWYSLWLYLT